MESLALRKRFVAFTLAMAETTCTPPSAHERRLLDRYEQGSLTLEQVEDQLADYEHSLGSNRRR